MITHLLKTRVDHCLDSEVHHRKREEHQAKSEQWIEGLRACSCRRSFEVAACAILTKPRGYLAIPPSKSTSPRRPPDKNRIDPLSRYNPTSWQTPRFPSPPDRLPASFGTPHTPPGSQTRSMSSRCYRRRRSLSWAENSPAARLRSV